MPKNTKYRAKEPDENGFIDYDPQEDAVWRDLVARQQPSVERLAAAVFLEGQKQLDLPKDRVPQCVEVSQKLQGLTGWKVAPVPALIGFKQFFRMLSEQTFPAASFIRSREDFDYIEEPDIFHEIYGHTPLLADARFARFSQVIGETGLNCDKSDYAWLIRLYWFTVEFGLIREDGAIKALGSGLASSPEELEHAIHAPSVERKPFDVMDILRTPYRIDINQPIYFVLEDVAQLTEIQNRDLLGDIRKARDLGLHAPTYPAKQT
ncbi:phenylalanine 4-hydroxylase [Pacificibacter maritimus]|uniref:phenylalanine 4-monooxygenase n=1 Tax=Pacificibacter maritimus TaxID=762213 RepID=A0A3N4V384_9RHOB|nr:phenylalanine 4-monooxygenase [Pacificibacter maritimus]RPE67404.1 phenylalanine 4-hydroxylase [Pacificibacter maritimus]